MWGKNKTKNKTKSKKQTHSGHHLYGTGPQHFKHKHVRNWELITTRSASPTIQHKGKQNKKTKQKILWGVEKSFDMSDCIILLRAPKIYQMNVYNRNLWKCVPKFQTDSNNKKRTTFSNQLSSLSKLISSVLNEAGKLTSIFGFQQARYDEKVADCRPGM